MSRPHWPWWSYVKEMIRRYPERSAELDRLRTARITVNYSTMGHSGGVSRQTEQLALKDLPESTRREYQAVADALTALEARANGDEVLKMIRLVFWKRTHTLAGAALNIHVSESTARRWHREFIYLVAEKYGLYEPKTGKMIP